MLSHIQRLIEALRDELKQYGEMLALLDQQQEQVMARAADELLQTVATVNQQSGVIQQARHDRHECQRDLARFLELEADAPFEAILPHLPEDHRYLVRTLVDENNELLLRVQQRARQNHLLLTRSLELMQRFINTLVPGTRATVYNGDGHLFSPAVPARALYEAVG
ncbi:MAG: flagellar protein FlgN [Verrucomicrobiota bacterium]|jgi:flagellar biosynthesis/type III secretory pathway chaperone